MVTYFVLEAVEAGVGLYKLLAGLFDKLCVLNELQHSLIKSFYYSKMIIIDRIAPGIDYQ